MLSHHAFFLEYYPRAHNTREFLMTFILYSGMNKMVWSHQAASTPQNIFFMTEYCRLIFADKKWLAQNRASQPPSDCER
jgi:hypothetical protein